MDSTTISQMVSYINNHQLAVLSTVAPDGKPFAVTLYVVSDEYLNLYFMTKVETTKHRNMLSNPYVFVTLSDESDLSTLQASGKAEPIDPALDSQVTFNLMRGLRIKINEEKIPISKLNAGGYVIYKVQVNRATLTNYEAKDVTQGVTKLEYLS